MTLSEAHYRSLNALIIRLRPIRNLPLWARYTVTILIVLIFFAVRWLLRDVYPDPYLLFLPAIILAAVVFDRGSGFLATGVSSGLAIYFFVDPSGAFAVGTVSAVLSLVLFALIGGLLAALIEALRNAVEAVAEAYVDVAESRDEAKRTADLLESVIEGLPDPIFVKDKDGRYVRGNSALAALLAVPKSVLSGNRDRDFLPEDIAKQMEETDRRVMEEKRPVAVEEHVATGVRGEKRWYLTTRAPWHAPTGGVLGVIGVARDIDDRKHAEDAVRAANDQRETLLSDINHRVKNHLQAVVSMLSMSRRKIADPAAREALDNAAGQLTVLARVYDRLQLRGPGATTLDAREFIESICADIAPMIIGVRPIAIRVDAERVQISSGRAVSLGLVLNEAITNALKHAFAEDAEGVITVDFGRHADQLALSVGDDGRGFDIGAVAHGSGVKLIRALAVQLGGEAAWRSDATGTTLELVFPAEAPD